MVLTLVKHMRRDTPKTKDDALYVFCNPLIPGIVKIGRAARPMVRARNMSASQPFRLTICNQYPKLGFLERYVHAKLQTSIVSTGSGREWFAISAKDANTAIRHVIADQRACQPSALSMHMPLPVCNTNISNKKVSLPIKAQEMISDEGLDTKQNQCHTQRNASTTPQKASKQKNVPDDAMGRSPLKLCQISPKRFWSFVWNGFPKEWREQLENLPVSGGVACVMPGSRAQDIVLKGYIELAKKARPHAMGLPKTVAWEGCGVEVQTTLQAKCQLYEALTWGTCKRDLPFMQVLPNPYPWQAEMLEILRSPVDPRAIWWIHEPAGSTGKTTFLKHICSCMQHLKPIVLSGRAGDMMYAISDYERKNQSLPGCVLVNLPRSFDASFLSYPGLESIKDMLFFSSKYKGGMVNGSPPHMAIFANVPPDTTQLSKDRWRIRRIENLSLRDSPQEQDAQKKVLKQSRIV
jgi:hypothetical protein